MAYQRCAQCVSNPVGPSVSSLACLLFCSDQLLFLAHRSTGHFPPLLGWVFPPWSESPYFFFTHSSFFFFPLPLTFSWFPALLHPMAMPLWGSQSESFPPFFHWLLAFFQVAFFLWPTSPPPHSTLSKWHVFSQFTSLAQTNPATPLCHTLSKWLPPPSFWLSPLPHCLV